MQNITAPLGGLYVACFAFSSAIRQLDIAWMTTIAVETAKVAVKV